jgi:8-oxo-dGTP diphosphatase
MEQKPSVTVDIVLFTLMGDDLKVLLVKRKYPPFKDSWAVPGGFVKIDEPLDEAAIRELREETNVSNVYLEQLYTFGEPKRDPRGRVITICYVGLVHHENFKLKASTDASDVSWYSAYSMPKLGFDHKEIIEFALKRLRAKIGYSNIILGLLPDEFTLSELQRAYEIILNKQLDKRNFRKKIFALEIIKELPGKIKGKFRPAQVYKFISKNIETFKVEFRPNF